jgi:2-amino-4-hydroxy-6-hydroxymethyldihydropteridine diphosphokinase
MSSTIFLGFGSNLGDRENNLIKAVDMVKAMEGFELIACSPIYIAPAVDMVKPAPDFLNMVIKGEYIYRPLELLNALKRIERKLGRTGKGKSKPRPIDIDILFFGNEIIETEQLSIPHRKMTERLFVMVPLLQIEPEIVHPITGAKISSYLKDKDKTKLIMYKESIGQHV